MKKETTILLVCALFLAADAVCLQQTLRVRQDLNEFSFSVFLGLEVLSALLIFALAFLITRKLIAKQINRRSQIEIFPPLRRLV